MLFACFLQQISQYLAYRQTHINIYSIISCDKWICVHGTCMVFQNSFWKYNYSFVHSSCRLLFCTFHSRQCGTRCFGAAMIIHPSLQLHYRPQGIKLSVWLQSLFEDLPETQKILYSKIVVLFSWLYLYALHNKWCYSKTRHVHAITQAHTRIMPSNWLIPTLKLCARPSKALSLIPYHRALCMINKDILHYRLQISVSVPCALYMYTLYSFVGRGKKTFYACNQIGFPYKSRPTARSFCHRTTTNALIFTISPTDCSNTCI